MISPNKLLCLLACCLSAFFFSCQSKRSNTKIVKETVVNSSEVDDAMADYMATILNDSTAKRKKLNDSVTLYNYRVLKSFYESNNYEPIWSSEKKWNEKSKSLLAYLDTSIQQGLFKEDYHYSKIIKLKNYLEKDVQKKATQVMWANAELMMTDALASMLKDLKQGRLVSDSLSWSNDSAKIANYFLPNINKIVKKELLDTVLNNVQPKHEGYIALKSGIKKFIDSMDNSTYTYVSFPFKDSVSLRKTLKKRLAESDIEMEINSDSLAISKAIKAYQNKAGIAVDGKYSASLVKKMNSSDKQKLYNIAITLDRYKLLPAVMPKRYIWVNLPTYHLKVVDSDTIALVSKIICGKTTTPTPLLTSAISDIVLYPTWTVPSSIIEKDMLPGLKRNPNYLARRGLYLITGSGKRINPGSINWSKYTKGIPYRIQQASGDRNALGIMKFNFENPFAVYLHDTNQRYLFANGVRCLSHGCVRVQEWKSLADYLVRNDSINLKAPDTLRFNTDSVKNWMATKINRSLPLKNKVPLFIQYFTCELVNGKIKFHDDMYFDDRDMKQQYFTKN
jgi:L,D-transpeptidase YcbB